MRLKNGHFEVLAQRISETWKCHVETEFPGRIVNTIVDDDYGPSHYVQ